MIAACDTFRSGAVEQLKTHCNRLSIPLYERGYEKDPAKVAYEATMQAARSKTDVVLVDTAGAPIPGKKGGHKVVQVLESNPGPRRAEGHVGEFHKPEGRFGVLANEAGLLAVHLQKGSVQQN